MIRPLMIALVLATVCGCSKDGDRKNPEQPVIIDPGERDRGLRACKTYVERACRCAKERPALAGDCNKAQSVAQSLQMMIDTVLSDQVDNNERRRLIKSVRGAVNTCFSEVAKMDPKVCPPK